MSETKHAYHARFLGRRFISGLVSEEKLKQLVSEINENMLKHLPELGPDLFQARTCKL